MDTTKRLHRLWRRGQPYLRVFGYAVLAAAFTSLIYKIIFGFGVVSPWLLFDFAFESLFALALYCVCPRLRIVLAVQLLIGSMFHIANGIKISYLGMPIIPSDFVLIRDVYLVLPEYKVIFFSAILVGTISTSVYLFAINCRMPRRSRALLMLPAVFLMAWILVFSENYSDTFGRLIKNQQFGIPFLLRERGEAMGIPLSFTIDLANFLKLRRERPNAKEVHAALKAIAALNGISRPPERMTSSTSKRNIYVFLLESFWDPNELLGQKTDYLAPEFRKLWKKSGGRHMLSPTFGGGTANVEFEVFCGIPSRSVGKGIVFQTALANRLDCIPKILQAEGYRTYAFHPFDSGYYNRNIAFPLIGFQTFFSIDNYLPHPQPGDFVSDEYFLRSSVKQAQFMADGNPFLAYMMTFAGHWPYTWLASYKKEIELPDKADHPDLEMVERHLNVNKFASTVVAQVVDEILATDPTALIVISGDHLPTLANDLTSKTDYEDITDWHYYQTPLVVLDKYRGDAADFPPEIPAYALGQRLLSRLHIPYENQEQFNWFNVDHVIRSLPNGGTLVESPGDPNRYKICTPQDHNALCDKTHDWLHNVHIVSMDLVVGEQLSLREPASSH